MNAEARGNFSVLVVDQNPGLAMETLAVIQAAGFQASMQATFSSALAKTQFDPPHIIVLGHDVISREVEGFLASVREMSSEILVILCCHPNQKLTGLQLQQRNLIFDQITRPVTISLELVNKIVRAAECSLMTIQLHDEKGIDWSFAGSRTSDLPPMSYVSNETQDRMNSLVALVKDLTNKKHFDETVERYLAWLHTNVQEIPCVYFRYLPGHQSLIFSSSMGIQNDELRSIGLEFSDHELSELEIKAWPDVVAARFQKMIADVFDLNEFTLFVHEVENEKLGGVFAVLGNIADQQQKSFLDVGRHIFQTRFECNHLLKEKFDSDEIDSSSGALNKRALMKRVTEEISRSRRLRLPVSTIHMQFVDSMLIASKLGVQSFEAQMRAIATILKQTSRTNDLIGRYSRDELVLVLPHTDQRGAAIKAERLRTLFAATRFPLLVKQDLGPLRMSLGVSEYPGLASDTDSLFASGFEALNAVAGAGGFKVCIAAPPIQFEPDFVFDRNARDFEEGL